MKAVDEANARWGSANVDVAAAQWSEALREPGAGDETRASFEAWLTHDASHAEAWQRVQSARALVDAAAESPELLVLRHETLARIGGDRYGRRRRYSALAASLVLATLIGIGIGIGVFAPERARRAYDDARAVLAGNVYETAVGQRTTVTLEDGSVLTLNTDSRVSVHYKNGIRGVTLERGQALFKVAKDAAHPFVVTADGREVKALGTEFDVRLSSTAIEVTLLEGRVAITRDAPAARGAVAPRGAAQRIAVAELVPGQQLVDADARTPVVRKADVRRITSWRNGQLVFEGERLADAVAEMNRYARRQIVLGDSALNELRVSGAFDTGGTDTFVEALSAYFPIDVTARDDDSILLELRPSQAARQ
jgi:transmembrane sensor